jgi:hypothetical protein
MGNHLLGSYVRESRDSMPKGTEKHVVDTADDLLLDGVVGRWSAILEICVGPLCGCAP